jgi:RNA polymerase sigma-70 factor (ECF subfamily)
MDDEALACALVAREPRAATLAWQRFSPLVRRIVCRAIGPVDEVEDLAQEVFISLFSRVNTLREPRLLRAFVISIASIALRRELRRRRLRSWLGLRPNPAAVDRRVVYPDPLAREALKRLDVLLDHVSARERRAFLLRFLDGMEVTEVAAGLGVSLATAKRCLARSQRRIQNYVERDPLLRHYLLVTGFGRRRRA